MSWSPKNIRNSTIGKQFALSATLSFKASCYHFGMCVFRDVVQEQCSSYIQKMELRY